MWDLTTDGTGTSTTFTLSRWTLNPSVSTPAPTTVATLTHDTGDGSVMSFPSGYVALDPSGATALFGYTTTADGYPGSVVKVSVADGGTTELDAPGNFDAAWLDANRFVVNAGGLLGVSSGTGLYVANLSTDPAGAGFLVSGLGDYGGSILVDASFLFAGGADASFTDHVYAVDTATYEAAISGGTTVDASSEGSELLDPDGNPVPSSFAGVPGRLVTTPFGMPMTSYTLQTDGSAPSLSDPRVLVSDGTFTAARAAGGGGRILLAHQDPTTFAVVSLLLVQ